MATSGPGSRPPKTCTRPSASRTRSVPRRMKRRSRLDNRRMAGSGVRAGANVADARLRAALQYYRPRLPAKRGAELARGVLDPAAIKNERRDAGQAAAAFFIVRRG